MYMAIQFKFASQRTCTAYSVYGVADCYVTCKFILFPPFCLYLYSPYCLRIVAMDGLSIVSILDPFLSVWSLSS